MFIQQVYQENIYDVLESASKISFINNGADSVLGDNDNLLEEIKKVFADARLMPALGVSLHDETVNALKTGKWLKFDFLKTQSVNGLMFDALLLKLEQTGGVSFIREYQGKYEGRCVYVALNQQTDLDALFSKHFE